MKKFTLILITLCSFSGIIAQEDSLSFGKVYRAWILLKRSQPTLSGVLFDLKDSSVVISNSSRKEDYYNGTFDLSSVDVRQIEEIKIRRQGRGLAMLVGGISGFVAGSVIGYYYNKHLKETPSYSYRPAAVMSVAAILVVSTGIGIGIGAIAGAKTTIPIHGKQSAYEQNKLRLSECAFKQRAPNLVCDADGNSYRTIFLCGKVWMAEDLRVTRYRNGDPIPVSQQDILWEYADTGTMCWLPDDASQKINSAGLYNGKVVSDPRGLCPKGWHMPTYEEWTSLVSCIGVTIPQESGTIISVRNIRTFGAPGCYRYPEGIFSAGEPISWQWWSASRTDATHLNALFQQRENSAIFFSETDDRTGLPVRCIRD